MINIFIKMTKYCIRQFLSHRIFKDVLKYFRVTKKRQNNIEILL